MAEAAIVIEERRGLAMVQVSAWPDTAARVRGLIAAAVGVHPPERADEVATGNAVRIFPLAPHRWLVVTPQAPRRDLQALLASIPAADAAVVEVGAGRCTFRVAGARARALLGKSLPIDLHPAAFPAGRCVQSAMAHVGVLVHAVEADAFEIIVSRGFAQYFLEVLQDAALEYLPQPARSATTT